MKLRVHPERCNKAEDANLEGYYKALKAEGMPFAKDNSDKYGPLTPEQLTQTLYEFKTKQKTSPMAQLADLYLWPICMGGYHASNRPYQRLTDDGKLIDCHIRKTSGRCSDPNIAALRMSNGRPKTQKASDVSVEAFGRPQRRSRGPGPTE
ncbi:DUF3800 domain-containing protein [Rhizobium sp. CF122]|uniref:DUF3800 domain-containing protein n=1 Tax=Rhizobium sp. CF122 TaxID=1144312 RepID=UPI0002FFF5DC|nr:DUF3800 domain-containing protein [Rhizobium sp. CF122]